MQINLTNGQVKSVAHADIITFNTDLIGPKGIPVKLTVEVPWGQGEAWLYDLEQNGKPAKPKGRQKQTV